MNRYLISALSAFILFVPVVALSMGEIKAINCANQHLYIAAADWGDTSGGWVPYSHHWVAPKETVELDCKKTWIDSKTPGCKIVLNTADNEAMAGMGMGRKTTGSYYAYFHEGCYIFKIGSACPLAIDLKRAAEACN